MANSNFIVRGGGDFSGLYKSFNSAQKKMSAFQSGMTRAMKGLTTVLSTVAIGKFVKDSTSMAMGVESAVDNINRNMGRSAAIFNNWAQTQSKALGMARADAYKYGSTFSNLLGSFSSGAKETADSTEKLMKAAAIISSKTGRTYEDTAERIRSGLLGSTEAIEDLGVYTQVSMLESTDAFKKFANGKTWAKLSYQTQQQIRLAAILEQTYKRYGDTLADTTQTRQAQFLASLKNIQLNFGQAFLPIYNAVLPALTSLSNKIEQVTSAFSSFTQALFGKATLGAAKDTEKQADAMSNLGDSTKTAGKQAKNALAGFDEINQLDLNKGDTTGGAVGIVAADPSLQQVDDGTGGAMDNVSIKAQEMASKVRQAFTDFKDAVIENKDIILPALGAIAGALAGLTVSMWASSISTAVKGLWGIISAHPIGAVITVLGLLVGAFISAYKTNDEFKARVDSLWNSLQSALIPVLQQVGETLLWVWNSVIVPFGQYLIANFVAAWQTIGAVSTWVWQNVLTPLGNYLLWLWNSVLVPLGNILIGVLGVAFKFVADVAMSFWQNVLVPLGNALISMFMPAVEAVSAVLSFLWNKVFVPFASFLSKNYMPIIESIIKVFEYLWKNVFKPVAEFVGGVFFNIFDSVFRSIGTIINGLKTTFIGLMDFITGVFTGNWSKAWAGVRDIFKGVFDSLWGIVKLPLNLVIDGINAVISALNSIKIDAPDWVPGLGGKSFGINIPAIPKLAAGGITNGPMLAMVGDNPGGREVVSPLDDLTDIIASALGSAILGAQQFNSGSGENREIVIELDGVKLGRAVLPKLNQEAGRQGYKPILQI